MYAWTPNLRTSLSGCFPFPFSRSDPTSVVQCALDARARSSAWLNGVRRLAIGNFMPLLGLCFALLCLCPFRSRRHLDHTELRLPANALSLSLSLAARRRRGMHLPFELVFGASSCFLAAVRLYAAESSLILNWPQTGWYGEPFVSF